MPPKAAASMGTRGPPAKDADKKKKKKKKKKVLNDAQSQTLNDLQARTYMDTLLTRYISQTDKKDEYEATLTPEELAAACEKYKASLVRTTGNADLIHAFLETKTWLDSEAWKNECVQWKERKYREELYGEEETYDPNVSDEDEDEDD